MWDGTEDQGVWDGKCRIAEDCRNAGAGDRKRDREVVSAIGECSCKRKTQ